MQNKQQEVWEQEHTQQKAFATMHTLKPSNYIPQFAGFLQQQGLLPSTDRIVLDIGCGKGRNSVYFASLGYRVIGTDFSEKALADARTRSAQAGSHLEYELVDLTQEWPYNPNFVDVIIDCNSTVFIPNEGREFAIAEAFRVLKPGGFYFFYGLALLSGQSVPNYSEKGFFEKHYSLEELTSAYKSFSIVQADVVQVEDMMDGHTVVNNMWYAIFQKPAGTTPGLV